MFSDSTIDQTKSTLDASGEYPLGVHTITFWAADGCGGVSSCKRVVTVKDCLKPSPICQAVTIELMPSSGLAEIMAMSLEMGNSYDNLTEYDSLKILIERYDKVGPGQDAPDMDADTSVVLTCDDLPPVTINPVVEVAVWVGDEAGNWDYCVTTITVEDWLGACGSPPSPHISCFISNEYAEPVSLVTVDMSSLNGTQSEVTNSTGVVSFSLFNNGQYTISPHKDINPLNGLNSYDLYLMQRHLLGIKPLTSPYKLIAADINNNCEVSIADIVALRKMILDPVNAEFKNNSSWRFVDGGYTFPDPYHPCDFSETKMFEFPSMNGINSGNFIAIKIGDVSGDHNPKSLQEGDLRHQAVGLNFDINDRELVAGQEYEVEMRANQFNNMEAYQYTLEWNRNLIDMIDCEPIWAGLSEANFGLSSWQDGYLTTSWNGSKPTSIPNGEVLYTVKFRALTNGQLSQALSINSIMTPAVAYQNNGEEMDVRLHFMKSHSDRDHVELFQNEPNPFDDQTRISFHLPQAASATLTIHDMTGKVVYQASGDFTRGYNSFVVFGSEMPTQGLLYYTVQSGENRVTRQMTLSE
ncbi:MAG: T9SS type A sorting domain-containing protein [Saprospiraceae bacterium]|nr:T9SS type A sorting domain-containing protein [Saprospiraceae bacterium]